LQVLTTVFNAKAVPRDSLKFSLATVEKFGRISTMDIELQIFLEDSEKLIKALRALSYQINDYLEEHVENKEKGKYDDEAPKWFEDLDSAITKVYHEVQAEYEHCHPQIRKAWYSRLQSPQNLVE